MKYLLYISIIGCIILCAGCRPAHDPRLAEADRLMEESPDSAYSILESIDTLGLHSSDRPYYALLYTQACVKNDKPTDIALIRNAYSSYSGDFNGNLGIRSSFYMGEALFNEGRNEEAALYYLLAYDESKRLSNYFWYAKSAERMADLYFMACNYDRAEKYRLEAIEGFGLSGALNPQKYAVADLATVYINEGKDKAALDLLDSLRTVCSGVMPVDSALNSYIRRPMIDALVSLDSIGSLTMGDLEFLQRLYCEKNDYESGMLLSRILDIRGECEAADSVLRKAIGLGLSTGMPDDKVEALYADYTNARMEGNLEKALDLTDSLLVAQNDMAERIIEESLSGVERDFYIVMSVRNRERVKLLWFILGLLLIIMALSVFFFVRFHNLKMKANKKELEAVMESMSGLQDYSDTLIAEKERLNSEIGGRQQKVETLFREKCGALNILCDEYFNLGEMASMQELILANIEKEVRKQVSRKSLKKMEEELDMYIGGIMQRFRAQCAFLSEEDIKFVMLQFAGFSAKSVALLLKIKLGNFYTKRKRLSEKILNSDAPDKEEFIKWLR